MAAYAAVADGYTLIAEKGRQYAGDAAVDGLPKAFLDEYQKKLFGSYVNYNGVRGVNSVDIPVLIAHGKNDSTISYDAQSLISRRGEITNKKVVFLTYDGVIGTHSGILRSERAELYRKSVDEQIAQIKNQYGKSQAYDKIRRVVADTDHALYSEINYDLLDKTVKMFDNILKGG